MSSQQPRPQSTLSAFFGSIGRSSTAPSTPASTEAAATSSSAQPGYGATATTSATTAGNEDDGDEAEAGAARAPVPSLHSRSRTFFKRRRPNPTETWLHTRRPPSHRKRVRLLFALGVLLLLGSLASALLLLLNLVAPIPALVPSSHSPGTASLWFALSAALVVAPSLLVFELSSKATQAVHSASTAILGLALLLLLSITPLRRDETALCAPAIALALIACAWALLSSAVVGRLQLAYAVQAPPGIFIPTGEHPQPPGAERASNAVNSDADEARAREVNNEQTPLLAAYTTSVRTVRRSWRRVLKLALAVLGSLTISILIGLQTFNLLLTGTDAGLHPAGDRVLVDPQAAARAHNALMLGQGAGARGDKDSIEVPPLPLPHWFLAVPPFRIHVGCESTPPHTGHDGAGSQPSRPTALVFTERGVAGEIGARWVREMVRRAGDGDEYGNGKPGGDNATDDGHLSLEKVCFFDRLGHGHSDYVAGGIGRGLGASAVVAEDGVASVRLNTLALYSALGTLGVLNGSYPVDPDRQSNDTKPARAYRNGPRQASNQTHSRNGTSPPFMLIAQGYGALHARHFATSFPSFVHSILYIDAETPSSFYTDRVSRASGLRAGYGAWGHAWGLHTLGFLAWDVLPALLEPLGIVRLAGLLLLGRGARDRVLAPRWRGGARKYDAGGGGWRLLGAGGANARLLSTSLAERLDANRGAALSSNYAELTSQPLVDVLEHDVLPRPTAVLSSFWKVHADLPGWAEIQRSELVAPAMRARSLVGWWRLGSPSRSFSSRSSARTRAGEGGQGGWGGGGDTGEAEGICAEPLGRVFCEEAVRKLLAQGDLEAHRPPGRKAASYAAQEGTSAARLMGGDGRGSDEEDDLDPRHAWPRHQSVEQA